MTINRLYFAQHGLAVDKSENPERPLSETGVKQTEAIAKHLSSIAGIAVNHIFHSGKLRASQTAEIFARTIKHSSISAVDGLSPNDDVTLLAQNLNINALYVGHLPHLEKLAAYLVTGNENGNIIRFQNSAVLCLENNDSHYQLRWYITPELL